MADYTHMRVVGHTPCTKVSSHKDVAAAITRFKTVAKLGHDLVESKFPDDDPKKTLTLFVAPEWYFKKTGDELFSNTDIVNICEGIKKESANYPNTLFVFGTILWSIPFTGKTPVGAEKDPKFIVYNTAASIQAGKIVHFCHKSHEGYDVEFKKKGEIFPLSEAWLKGRKLDDLWDKWKSFTVAIDGTPEKAVVSNYFKHKGIEFGIEICADTFNSVLKKTGKTVDVQILISCGAVFTAPAMSVKVGGCAVQCEGATDKDAENQKSGFNVVKAVKGGFEPDLKSYYKTTDGKTFNGKSMPDRIVIWDELIELP